MKREEIIADMCYTYRHDYGLTKSKPELSEAECILESGMTPEERKDLWNQMASIYDRCVAPHLGSPELEKKVKSIKNIRDVQGMSGTWDYDSYMHGMYNGLELALSILEGRQPGFKNVPKKWMGVTSEG